MQKSETVKIGAAQRPYLIRELSVRSIWDLVNNAEDDTVKNRMASLLRLGCPDLTQEALLEMYPSEIEELWDAFERVNSSFLAAARLTGLDQVILKTVRDTLAETMAEALKVMIALQGSTPPSALLSSAATGP